MELLVAIAIVLAITLIAIPNLSSFRLQSNENSAISSLRAIYQAETQYGANYPTLGFACSLTALGSPAPGQPVSPTAAHLLPTELATGRKSGYTFAVARCIAGTSSDQTQHTGFLVTAVPQQVGRTGHRAFCIDGEGVLTVDPTGGTQCSEALP